MPLSAGLSLVFTCRLAKGVLISTFSFFLSLSFTLIEQAANSNARLAITMANTNLVATFLIVVLRWNLVPRPSIPRHGRQCSEWLQASGRSWGFRQTLPSPHLTQNRDRWRKYTGKFAPRAIARQCTDCPRPPRSSSPPRSAKPAVAESPTTIAQLSRGGLRPPACEPPYRAPETRRLRRSPLAIPAPLPAPAASSPPRRVGRCNTPARQEFSP